MEVTRDRKLRIPRFLRLRTDKQATACTTDQLDGHASLSSETAGTARRVAPEATSTEEVS